MSAKKDAEYPARIAGLIKKLERGSELGIDLKIQVKGKVPTSATSEFLTNKEQGDWAERLVSQTINQSDSPWLAVPYGLQDGRSAGDEGFGEYYQRYQQELNTLGKRPDLLIFARADFPDGAPDVTDEAVVRRAVAAFEVRSSAFRQKTYRDQIGGRTAEAVARCQALCRELVEGAGAELLRAKNEALHASLGAALAGDVRMLAFKRPSWRSSDQERALVAKLAQLQECLQILKKRDFLSITPKVEDIALVNRWIARFGVPHFYVQVFFDGAFAISFEDILRIAGDAGKEGTFFRVERDVKNQAKTTIKINVDAAVPLIPHIDMPQIRATTKELDRGRMLFYVTFEGGAGRLDAAVLDALVR